MRQDSRESHSRSLLISHQHIGSGGEETKRLLCAVISAIVPAVGFARKQISLKLGYKGIRIRWPGLYIIAEIEIISPMDDTIIPAGTHCILIAEASALTSEDFDMGAPEFETARNREGFNCSRMTPKMRVGLNAHIHFAASRRVVCEAAGL